MMSFRFHPRFAVTLLAFGTGFTPAAALPPASTDAASWAADLAPRYGITPNVAYLPGDSPETRLDVYAPRSASAAAPVPTVVYFHGGGWTGGDKSVAVLRLLPWLERGWAAVNLNYRLGVAPAAVEDGRCAVSWVIANAAKFGFDPAKIVLTGDSAGSHLALITGMLTPGDGFDSRCPGAPQPELAAVVSWFGASDVVDLLEGEHAMDFAKRWFADVPNRLDLARRLSPIHRVRAGLPAILSVHGEDDFVVRHEQAVSFHRTLDAAKVPNRLVTVKGGGHGDFPPGEMPRIHAAIRDFLVAQGIERPAP